MIKLKSAYGGRTPLRGIGDPVPPAVTPGEAGDDDGVVLVVGVPERDEGYPLDPESMGVVGRLVVAGIASRLGASVSAIESLQSALDEMLRRQASTEPLTIRFASSDDGLTFRAGPLSLLLPDRRRLERRLATADGVDCEEAPRGTLVSGRMSWRSSDSTRR
jgi:hypothetical protein